ncbi:MAG: ATP synthase F1 subunit gamma [Flavobacteriales bacterium]
MANLKEIRNRISSVNSTMQITSAMKMVSAAKLKRAQDAITDMRPYAEKLQEILANVASNVESTEGVYSEERGSENLLVIAINSNRGLCGAFNNNINKQVTQIKKRYPESKLSVLPIGKKAHESYTKTNEIYTDGFQEKPYEVYNDLTFTNVAKIATEVMNQFKDGKWDKVLVVYNKFKNAAVQLVTTEQFLPVLPPEGADTAQSIDYLYEPSEEEIITELIPRSLKVQLYKAILDSNASEHGARMTAMHKATDNAGDLKDDLKLFYNKARQAAITGEILEIVGGAEALNG